MFNKYTNYLEIMDMLKYFPAREMYDIVQISK